MGKINGTQRLCVLVAHACSWRLLPMLPQPPHPQFNAGAVCVRMCGWVNWEKEMGRDRKAHSIEFGGPGGVMLLVSP